MTSPHKTPKLKGYKTQSEGDTKPKENVLEAIPNIYIYIHIHIHIYIHTYYMCMQVHSGLVDNRHQWTVTYIYIYNWIL